MSADLMVFDKSKVPAERLLSRNMNIEIYHLLEGADQAQGLAVVIDVFRAFSLECYLFSRGVQKIYAVGREETAWELKREHPEYLMAGEQNTDPYYKRRNTRTGTYLRSGCRRDHHRQPGQRFRHCLIYCKQKSRESLFGLHGQFRNRSGSGR